MRSAFGKWNRVVHVPEGRTPAKRNAPKPFEKPQPACLLHLEPDSAFARSESSRDGVAVDSAQRADTAITPVHRATQLAIIGAVPHGAFQSTKRTVGSSMRSKTITADGNGAEFCTSTKAFQ